MAAQSRCVVHECPSKTLSKAEWGALFCFPANVILREKWFRNLCLEGLSDFTAQQLKYKGFRVCHRHFELNQFQNYLRKKLNYNSIPPAIIPKGLAGKDVPSTSEDVLLTSEDVPLTSEDVPLTSEDVPLTSEDVPLTLEDVPSTSESADVFQSGAENIVNVPSTSDQACIENILKTPRKRRKIADDDVSKIGGDYFKKQLIRLLIIGKINRKKLKKLKLNRVTINL